MNAAGGAPLLRGLATLLVLAALPAAVIESSLGGAAYYLLALLGLGLALRDPAGALARWRAMPEIGIAALLLVGLNLSSVLAFGLPARAFSWTPLLLMPLVALVAAQGLAGPRALFVGGALGAAAALGVSVVDLLAIGQERPTGTLNAIVFGQISVICTVYALAGLLRDPGRLRSLAYLAAVGAGIAATVASGTRGALLALPLLGALAWRAPAPAGAAPQVPGAGHRRALLAVALCLALGVAALGHRLDLWDRLTRIDDEVAAYQEGEVGARSVALRLAMWQATLDIVAERPLFGAGAHRFKPEVERLQAQGRYPADAVVYSHPHSLPMSILAQYGAIGLTVTGLAAWLAWRGLARSPPALRRVGRVTLAMWLVLGLTNDVFAHQNTLRVLAFGLALCAAMREHRSARPGLPA